MLDTLRGSVRTLAEAIRSATALLLALGVTLGVWVGSWLATPPMLLLFVVIAAGLLVAVLGHGRRAVWLPALLATALALGLWRYAAARPPGGAAGLPFYIGRDVTLTGTVAAEPEPLDSGENVRVAVDTMAAPGVSPRVSGLVLVHISSFSSLNYGDRLTLAGRLEAPPTLSGPGNYPAYLASQGIYTVLNYPRLQLLGTGAGNPLLALAIWLRQLLEGGIRRILPGPEAALLLGILLGTRTRALGALTAPFITAGMIHVVAISGLKVSLVAGAVYETCKRLLGVRIAFVPTLAALALYVLVTGATPAGLRSAVMWAFVLAAPFFGRRSDPLTSLALAAAGLTWFNPHLPWDLGFQFSLAGTAAIVLFEQRLERGLHRLTLAGYHLPVIVRETAAVTLAAQIGTLPLQLAGFGQVSLAALPANVLLLPLLLPIMVLGLPAALAGVLFPALGSLLGWLVYPLLWLMIVAVQALARLPLAALPGPALALLPVTVYYALVALAAWRPWHGGAATQTRAALHVGGVRPLWLLCGGVALLLAAVAWQAPRPVYILSVLYLRGGMGLLLTTPHGHTILIDGGDTPSLLDTALGDRLPFWRSRLDIVALSDIDQAHTGGLRGLLARYSVGRALDPGAIYPPAEYALWRAALRGASVPEGKLRLGARYYLDRGAYLDVLLPAALNPYEANTRAALRLVLGRFSLLLLNRAALVADPSELQADGFHHDTMLMLPSGASDPQLAAMWVRLQRPRLVVLPSPDDARDDPTADGIATRAAQGVGASVWQSAHGQSLQVSTDGLRYSVRATP